MTDLYQLLMDTRERTDLETLFHGDEPVCESSHAFHYLPPCSEEVTHRVSSCQGEFLICEAIAAFIVRASVTPAICKRCEARCADCWQVRPV